ncbi:D-glycero-beta-D-manno-heptose 1-phosphate adenylyltransferase [Sphingomonas sp. PB4P5]|uniref:D-glycero-beta-D-manno-heptose 1-phosphate adenylyltransferase n=1 Tax=Parasphingomonas puruogangriensis TaxID=3096155 RepID=UPI002FCB256A
MNPADKIVPRAALAERLAVIARPLVFTNGVFDLLHPGHVEYLARARSLGEALIVGLNADSSARSLGKGDDRPINPEEDRAWMLAALESVTLVTLFNERTPIELLHEVRPDIYVKGGDYDIDALEETRFVRSYGGEARAIAFRTGYSTTALLDRIRKTTP